MVKKHDELGREINDPAPMELPFGTRKPETLTDMIRRMIRVDVSAAASDAGGETFEEANDFDVDEDDAEINPTHHELTEEVVNEGVRFRKEQREKAARDKERAERAAASRRNRPEDDEDDVPEETDSAPSRSRNSPRSEKLRPRSPHRERPRSREDAESDDDQD